MKIRKFIAVTTWYDYILEVGAFLFVLSSIIYFIWFWVTAPDVIPIHFNFKGEADNYGSKTILVLIPIISILLYIALSVVAKNPRFINIPVKITKENETSIFKIAITITRILKPMICGMFLFILWHIKNFDGKDTADNTFLIIMSIFLGGMILCVVVGIIKMVLIEDKNKKR